MLRAGPGEDVYFGCPLGEHGVVHAVDLGAGQDVAVIDEAELPCDGPRRAAVVARDHLHPDSGRLAFGHGRDGLLAGRVNEAKEAQQGEPGLDVREAKLVPVRLLEGHCQDALPLRGHPVDSLVPVGRADRPVAV